MFDNAMNGANMQRAAPQIAKFKIPCAQPGAPILASSVR